VEGVQPSWLTCSSRRLRGIVSPSGMGASSDEWCVDEMELTVSGQCLSKSTHECRRGWLIVFCSHVCDYLEIHGLKIWLQVSPCKLQYMGKLNAGCVNCRLRRLIDYDEDHRESKLSPFRLIGDQFHCCSTPSDIKSLAYQIQWVS